MRQTQRAPRQRQRRSCESRLFEACSGRVSTSYGLVSSEQEPKLVEAKQSRDRAWDSDELQACTLPSELLPQHEEKPKKTGVNDVGIRKIDNNGLWSAC